MGDDSPKPVNRADGTKNWDRECVRCGRKWKEAYPDEECHFCRHLPATRTTKTILTKSQITSLITKGLVHEAFTHEDFGTFDISLIREQCLEHKFGHHYYSEITRELVDFIRKNRDIDIDRVNEIVDDFRSLLDPAICVEINEGNGGITTQLLIDGSHRILARYTRGYKEFPWYKVPISEAARPDMSVFVRDTDVGLDWGEEDYLAKRGIKVR